MEVTEDISNKKVSVRCQRIGCDAMFTDDNNPEGSCQYHPSVTYLDSSLQIYLFSVLFSGIVLVF